MKKVFINGLGRIGRIVFRLVSENKNVEIVGVNDLSTPENLAYLLKYDTAHGIWENAPKVVDGQFVLSSGKTVSVFQEKDANNLKLSGIDLVLECSGFYASSEKSQAFLNAGAKKVLINSPASGVDKTVVFGVNDNILTKDDVIISGSSCTTNCASQLLYVFDKYFGIEACSLFTVHAYTATQSLVDGISKKDLRRGRAAALNIVPSSTGAAKEVIGILPNLKGKIDGSAVRVPTIDGSIVYLTITPKSGVPSVSDVNKVFLENANSSLGIADAGVVSVDIQNDTHAGLYDPSLTQITNQSHIVIAGWYSNESSYSNNYVRTALKILSL